MMTIKAEDIDLFPRIVAKAQEERDRHLIRRCAPPSPRGEGFRAAGARRYVIDTIGFCAAMGAVCVFGIFIGWLAYRLG